MLNEYEVETIKFKGKYVNGKALDIITDFTNNSYIIKGSTGIGGTTALLNYSKGNCLIVSPNTGMIIDKSKGIYKSDKQIFIFSESKDKWLILSDYLRLTEKSKQNIIINCTPDQIIKLRSENEILYREIIKIPIFIDEYHAYSLISDFRAAMGEFLELVYNEWFASFKLSTATPNYLNLDVFCANVKYYKIERYEQLSKEIKLSYNPKDVSNFITSENSKGRTVVLFTNDKKYHTSNKFKIVKNLVGKNLAIKIAPYKRKNNINDSDLIKCDLLVCSSAYFAGFDIKKDVSICIISNQLNDSFKIGVNDIVQCYGRCREVVKNALFVNLKSKYNSNTKELTEYPKSLDEVNNSMKLYDKQVKHINDLLSDVDLYNDVKHLSEVTKHLYTNRAYLLKPILDKILNYQLYNDEVLRASLSNYGFIVSDFKNNSNKVQTFKNNTPFNERLTNLLSLDSKKLLTNYKTTKYNLNTKNGGSFSTKDSLELLTTYLLKITDSDLLNKLNNKRLKAVEFFNSVDLFLRVNVDTKYYFENLTPQQLNKANKIYKNENVTKTLKNVKLTNDWQYLYSCYKVSNNILPNNIEREIKLYETFYNSEFYKPLLDNKSHRLRNVKTTIINELKKYNIDLLNDELEWLNEVSKKVFKEFDLNGTYINYNDRKAIKTKMYNVLVYLLTNGLTGSVSEKKNREYSPLTQTPKALRSIIPIKLVSVDLTSANPQIVNNILNTNIGLSVYKNLMTNLNIDRNKAKKIYNSCLNNHFNTVNKAKKIYLDCGYTIDNALKLAKLTANVKQGYFYELMTTNEKILMEHYKRVLPIKCYRFHDALIMSLEDIDSHNIVLPHNVKSYLYHIEIFNDGKEYNGATTETPHDSLNLIENYIKIAS